MREVFFEGKVETSDFALGRASEALSFLNTFLENSNYLAGDQLTLADISCVTVSLMFSKLIPSDFDKFEWIKAWIERLRKDLAYFDDINYEKTNLLASLYDEQKKTNQNKLTAATVN